MKEIIEKLKSLNTITCGEPAKVYDNIKARDFLSQNHLPVFPEEYFLFIKYINGIKNETAELYGVFPSDYDGYFTNAVMLNYSLNRADKQYTSVLGHTHFDFLVYDKVAQQYQFRDKTDNDLVASFSHISEALAYMFL